MIAKFQGFPAVLTQKTDVLGLCRRTGCKLISLDFEGADPDPELLQLLAEAVLTPEDEAVLRRIEENGPDFICRMVDELWGSTARREGGQ